jgi:hypothetical protein
VEADARLLFQQGRGCSKLLTLKNSLIPFALLYSTSDWAQSEIDKTGNVYSSMGQFCMPKRNLRVVKWVGTIPAAAVCTVCNREFKVPVSSMKRVSDAQQLLKNRFAEHECNSKDDRQ